MSHQEEQEITGAGTPSKGIPVRITIRSVVKRETTVVRAQGELYVKAAGVYIRYAEPDEQMAGTMTTIKLTDRLIKIIRHGTVRSEQTFAAGREAAGTYETPQGRIELMTKTSHMKVDMSRAGQGSGSASWRYVLHAGGQAAGRFDVSLNVSPN